MRDVSNERRSIGWGTRPGPCRAVLIAAALALAAANAHGFDPPVETVGPIRASIEGPQTIRDPEAPLTVTVVAENSGPDSVSGMVRLEVIDNWRAEPDEPVSFSLSAGETARLEFAVTLAAPGPADCATYNAHYPIHAYVEFDSAGRHFTAHPVLVAETAFVNPPAPHIALPWQPYRVDADGALGLWLLPVHRTLVCVHDEPVVPQPVGWSGSHPRTRADVRFGQLVHRGDPRNAIAMHPPWYQGRNGAVLVEFPVSLPETEPIRLTFANAIRDTFPERGEPPSDGVTFRVRVAPLDAAADTLGEVLFERHTGATTWQEGGADLSAFAGRAIRLQLESHPGPKDDTTCDASYWAEPTLLVGEPVAPESSLSAPHLLGVIDAGDGPIEVSFQAGRAGMLDGKVLFRSGGTELSFQGFDVQVLGYALSDPRSPCDLVEIEESTDPQSKRRRVRHRVRTLEDTFGLVGEMWVDRGALFVRWGLENAPAPQPWRVAYIEDASVREWSRPAARVYAGVGNVLAEPEAFSLWYDGHRLSTAFVGFDFPGAMSIVQAVDATPSQLAVSPEARHYSLHTAHDHTMALIPSQNVWEAVKIWRDIDSRPAAGGVASLAGRFVFDLWGGQYRASADALERAFRYGLTDAIVIWHAWQRWGYDYRLPDVYPPNPRLGAHGEFRHLVKVCKDQNVLFAPHDNYIDFYPDADGFSYEHVSFHQNGAPQRGWLNEWRGAQAYRWRPDRLFPFLERNLKLIREDFAPTAYFIDVWASAGPHPYWTHDGQFFERADTRRIWRDSHAWIRDYLGGNAPQIGESGHDQLVGWIDGAQCQHLRWGDPKAGSHGVMSWAVRAADGERIPWLDAAYHDRFALHGAGYEERFRSGLDPRLHGMYSDDYITAEVLTGHPPMVNAAFGREVVRQYWLLHGIMRALAMRRIESVEFVGGDPHRQRVLWEGGAEVCVNRGEADWLVGGQVLPQFGFYARIPDGDRVAEAAIERRNGLVVEWAASEDGLYVNGRAPSRFRSVTVSLDSIAWGDDRAIDLALRWQARGPLDAPRRAFVHFVDASDAIRFQSDHDPPVPTTEWRGTIGTSARAVLPDECAAGQSFELRVGLYDPATSTRVPIDGLTDGGRAVRLGQVTLLGEGTAVTGIRWAALDDPEGVLFRARHNPSAEPVSFGALATEGACRLVRSNGDLLVVVLPDGERCSVRLDWNALPWPLTRPRRVALLDESGTALRDEPIGTGASAKWVEDGVLLLRCEPGAFAYRLAPAETSGGM